MSQIIYSQDVSGLESSQLLGFFVGWPNPPSAETLLRLLQNSTYRILAFDEDKVVGYITALTDGVLFGYISSLEVLPEYQKLGIGKELVEQMLIQLGNLYAVDLVCDPHVQPFYERCGLMPCIGMVARRYELLQNH